MPATAGNGIASLVDGLLVVGNEYTVEEVTAPNGYILAKPFTFTVNEDGSFELENGTDSSIGLDSTPSQINVSDTETSVTLNKRQEQASKLLMQMLHLRLQENSY